MIWDARVWSFFMWFVAMALFLCGFATPYNMPGNMKKIQVAFAGGISPEQPHYGMWQEVPDELQGTFTAVRAVLCISLVLIVASFILYIILFKRESSPLIQIVACVLSILTGVFNIVAVAIFRAASNEMGEGFWFVASSSGIFLINGIVLILMPWMDYQPPKWKLAESVPLTLIKPVAEIDGEETV